MASYGRTTPAFERPAVVKTDAPQEPFKRAVAGCMRAIACTPDLEVVYAPERPNLVRTADGAKVRLPEPPRKLDAREAAILRGHSDAIALRLACHDADLHRRLMPQAANARACFDAVEQARIEAIGARRMDGVADNLATMHDDRLIRTRLADVTQRSEVPLEEALAMIVRERLTGAKPPKSGERAVDLWRSWIEERIGRDLDRLGGAIEDQKAYAQSVQKLLAALEMGDDPGL